MKKITFYGSIECGDYEILASLLKKWLLTDEVRVRVRVIGEEIEYKNEKISLYTYNEILEDDDEKEPGFLINGNLSLPLGQAKELLEKLFQICKENNISSEFQCSEDGETASECFYIK